MDERRRLIQRTPVPTSPSSQGNGSSEWQYKLGRGTILLTVVLERFVFYGLTGNLVLYFNLNPYQWTAYNALLASYFFTGISFLTSFVGGFLGDAVLGRYKTLVLSFVVYCLGYIFLPVLSYTEYKHSETNSTSTFSPVCWPLSVPAKKGDKDVMPAAFMEPCSLTAYLVLFVIAIGTGIFRANMPPFGGDQAQTSRGEGQTTFFNWYYWSVNIGSLLALSIITWVQQTQSFFMGYLTTTICLGLAFLVFLTGSCAYTNRPKVRTVLQNVCSIVKEAAHRWRHRNKDSGPRLHSNSTVESSITEQMDSIEMNSGNTPTCCLDYAKFQYGGSFNNSQVEDVKKLGKIICVFLAFIPYWIVYFQMQTTFLLQGLHMKLNVTSGPVINKHKFCSLNSTASLVNDIDTTAKEDKVQIVAAWFSLFDVIFVVILIPLVDRVLYPLLARRGHPITMVTRITLGMFFACLAVLVAGVVENQRLKRIYLCDRDGQQFCKNFTIIQKIDNSSYNAADMNVFWQIPQYALIGVSEVFACVAGLDFAYQMAPRSMKGIIMGLFHLFTGIGSFLGIGAMYSFQNVWFFGKDSGNINCRFCDSNNKVTKQCHLDNYFFFLGGLQFGGMMLFVFVARKLQLMKDLHLVASPGNQQTHNVTPNVLHDNSSMNSASTSPSRSTYGRKSELRVSIQTQHSSENNS
ncbi:solute carrier family 15 member 4-like [Pecten maximus]|uniref:solute carrier family 15 member 4-like n=1 Tax=Pecten maximus TaxID=6579 RepID=UPI00145845D4|nr:solute carrier family 15 member 4-like [Pecten maximus]